MAIAESRLKIAVVLSVVNVVILLALAPLVEQEDGRDAESDAATCWVICRFIRAAPLRRGT